MAPPANDNFASAQVISGASGSVSGTVFDATREGSESSTLFGGTVARSVWYKWTCPASGWYKFFIDADDFVRNGAAGQSAYWCGMDLFDDGVLTAHTSTSSLASCRTLANTNDNPNGLWSHIAYNCVSGNVYYIRLASQDQLGINNYSSFDFVLQWDTVDTPANDLIASATDLDPLPANTGAFTTKDSTFQSGEATNLSQVGSAHQSQWFKFTPTSTGKYTVVIEHADVAKDNYDGKPAWLKILIGTVSGTTFTSVSGSGIIQYQLITGPPSSGKGALYADLVSGTEYHILAVSGWEQKYVSGYQFNGQTVSVADMLIEQVTPPGNDAFASPTVLSTTLPGLLTDQSNRGATNEAGENNPFTTGDVQSIWYSFTPTVTGWYKFYMPVESLVYDGDDSLTWGDISLAITPGTTVAAASSGSDWLPSANSSDQGYTDPGWQNVHNPTVAAFLTSGTTYRIYVFSPITSSIFNLEVVKFDLAWDEVPEATNADFADRETITGASGTEDIYFGPQSWESPDEPASIFWNTGFMGGMATVWYEWVAPSSGWFQFELEPKAGDDWIADIAIYTGSALNALTAIAKNEVGSKSTIVPGTGKTKIKFNAVSGTSYKIQLALNGNSSLRSNDTGTLTWATASAPTGDTGATAVEGGFNTMLVDNLGNSDDDNPSDGVSRLTTAFGDNEFWYTDGAIGRSKWFKQTITETGTLRIEAQNFDATYQTYMEQALLVYKGATFAGKSAVTAQGGVDAVMIGWEGNNSFGGIMHATNDDEFLDVPVTAGDVVWLCWVTLYDEDINGESTQTAFPADAPQGELMLKFGDSGFPEDPPGNDLLQDVNDGPWLHEWYITRSEWDEYAAYPLAFQREGYTFSATATAGDPTIAGFAATRNVVYIWDVEQDGPFAYGGMTGEWKLWVESDVDCVLGIYEADINFGDWEIGALVVADDDSGPTDQPEITHTFTSGVYIIIVDSKTPGFFTLKGQRLSAGTPPANDDFADAITISSIPASQSGTTVDATSEPGEREAEQLGIGPTDSVWYKYTPATNQRVNFRATCDSDNNDAYIYVDVWKGTVLDQLERMEPPTGPGGGIWRGYFSFFDTPSELERASFDYDLEAGQTYYIRVQTESGGSEDFTIYLDQSDIYVDIQVSGSEEMHGTLIDDAEVYINITASGTEIHHISQTTDAATVLVDIQPGGTELIADEYLDSATVYVDIQFLGGECYSTFSAAMVDSEADWRWSHRADWRWRSTAEWRWQTEDVQTEGVNC